MVNVNNIFIAVILGVLILGILSLVSTRPNFFTGNHVMLLIVVIFVLVIIFVFRAIQKNK